MHQYTLYCPVKEVGGYTTRFRISIQFLILIFVFLIFFVPPPGIEPGSRASEARVLSIKLRGESCRARRNRTATARPPAVKTTTIRWPVFVCNLIVGVPGFEPGVTQIFFENFHGCITCILLNHLVGMPGFEPGVTRTRIVYVTVTPHPDQTI